VIEGIMILALVTVTMKFLPMNRFASLISTSLCEYKNILNKIWCYCGNPKKFKNTGQTTL